MRRIERDERALPLADAPTTASLYCLAAMVADEASQAGFRDFAKAIEAALGGFLATLPAEQQANALRLSYELAMNSVDDDTAEPAAPRLRLVFSR
ncbi:hypothetical protein [Aestuariivirga litoralis]|nr:hypothetical protein [Aestuariivirga litoralis]